MRFGSSCSALVKRQRPDAPGHVRPRSLHGYLLWLLPRFHRQTDIEGRAGSFDAVEPELSTMAGDDGGMRQRQALARSLPDVLCREEGLEEPRPNRLGYTRASV